MQCCSSSYSLIVTKQYSLQVVRRSNTALTKRKITLQGTDGHWNENIVDSFTWFHATIDTLNLALFLLMKSVSSRKNIHWKLLLVFR